MQNIAGNVLSYISCAIALFAGIFHSYKKWCGFEVKR